MLCALDLRVPAPARLCPAYLEFFDLRELSDAFESSNLCIFRCHARLEFATLICHLCDGAHFALQFAQLTGENGVGTGV